MQSTLKNWIQEVLKNLSIEDVSFTVTHPESLEHGDYATNVALIASKKASTNPRELALRLKEELEKNQLEEVEAITVAGPGFINFALKRDFFSTSISHILTQKDSFGKNSSKANQKIIIEYTDPNPFKVFHIGHLMSNTIGESLSRLIENAGADIRRVCYQGDVGLHIAKAIWGMKQLADEMPADADTLESKVDFLGRAYTHGSNTYDDNEEVKIEIEQLNKKIYDRTDEAINNLYDWGRELSLQKFDEIYRIVGTTFDHFFFESETGPFGKQLVLEHVADGTFEESEGAIIYRGEKVGLHTRVFVNKLGLPTYEAKDLGLAKQKYDYYPYNTSIIVTASEVNDYFKVIISALKEIDPELGNKTTHIGHGFLKLPSGKMSSRKGNIITGESFLLDVISDAQEKLKEREIPEEEKHEIAEKIAVAAIKYSVLKQSIGRDIIYDQEKALSFEGDSGPYLQYTYVRSQSVLEKAQQEGITPSTEKAPEDITDLERLLYRFPEVAERALENLAPQIVVTYLIELAGAFNTYYGNTKIIDTDEYAPYRLALTEALAHVIKNGLWLLGIKTVERM